MTLLSAIPGLAAHQVDVPVSPVLFDFIKADGVLRDLNAAVGAAYPDAPCLSWLAKEKPEVWQALLSGENAVDRAYLAEDMAELMKQSDLLQRMYLKAFNIYATRPPVVEVQESFL